MCSIALVADVLEFQDHPGVGALVAHRADQPGAALAGQREHGQEVGLVEVDVQLAVDRRARRLDVGDIEDLPVGRRRESRRRSPVAHDRAGAVAAGEVGGLAGLLGPAGLAQHGA